MLSVKARQKTLREFSEGFLVSRERNSGVDDLEQLHGASLGAQAAGNALGSVGSALDQDDQVLGASLNALAAGLALLLVDHVHAGLVLGDGVLGASLSALAALGADGGGDNAADQIDLQASLVLMEFLVVGLGASLDASQTSLTLNTTLNGKLFHLTVPRLFIKFDFILHQRKGKIKH